MKLMWVFAFLPFCLGQVTEENCMALVDNFMSIINGSDLSVCSSYVPGPQCCSQMNENALGMSLNNAFNTRNVDLGIELRAVQSAAMALYPALTDLRISLINDLLRPLMNSSADLTIIGTDQFIGDLDRIRDEVLYNINATIAGSMDANITAEFFGFFIDGLSALYFNASFEATGSLVSGVGDEERMCGIDEIYMHFFPSMEQAEIASLGRRLQQIKVAYDVARAALSSLEVVLTALENFNASYTCTNVWTQQYACPLCAGQTAPLCQARCNEVLIGCMSSLQQMIIQLNVLLDFARGSVNSLLSGNPFANINVNSIADDYVNIFSTFRTRDRDYISLMVPDICGIGSRKRSVDSPLVRHKRQNPVVITFPNVTIDQSIVTMISDTLLPPVMNVSLYSDRTGLCEYLRANGQDSCTIGVGNVAIYTPSSVGLDISDQVDNPTGTFNLTQLHEQAKPLPYVMNNLLMDRSDIVMLYNYVLTGRPVPNLDFLNDTTTGTTPMPSASTPSTNLPGSTPTPSASDTQSTNPPGSTPTPSASDTPSTNPPGSTPTPSTSNTPSTTPSGGGGAAAVSYSLFITLVALLLASVL